MPKEEKLVEHTKLSDFVDRNKKMPLFSKILFNVTRLIDPAIQYALLGYGLGFKFWKFVGYPVKHIGVTGILSPRQSMVFGMSAVAALRQIYWVTFVNGYDFPPYVVVGINIVVSSINSLLLLRNPTWELGWVDYASIGLFALGSILETVSDIQRKAFMEDKKNAGKIQMNGLFAWARNINYGGFVLWRIGSALATGSPYAMFFPIINVYDFLARAVPVMEKRMIAKNYSQWEVYKKKTPYKLIPYII